MLAPRGLIQLLVIFGEGPVKAVVQRVSRARVVVAGAEVGAIERGMLVLLAVERGDGAAQRRRMVDKLAGLRIFPDAAGKMNLSVREVQGSVLVVSQFTLAAEVNKGYRPFFGGAEHPALAEAEVQAVCDDLRAAGLPVAQGQFGAHMEVSLVNDGPVTIWLDFPPTPAV